MQRYLLPVLFLFITSLSVSSQCAISEVQVERSECSSAGIFFVKINFAHENTGDLGFRVQGNGKNHGTFQYSDLPITIDGLEGNCHTEWEFVIRDVQFPDCAAEAGLGVVCCGGECDIKVVDFKVSECENNEYSVGFDLIRTQLAGLGFTVVANGELIDTFSYQHLPVKIDGIVSQNDVDNFIIVCDLDNPECCDTIVFESPCVCAMKNLRSRIVHCNAEDSTYFFQLNFDSQVTSDSFQIGGNNAYFGFHAYEDLAVTIGPSQFHADTAYYLLVDQKNSFCFAELVVPPVTECDTLCEIYDVHFTKTDCLDGNQFYLNLSFKSSNPGVYGFTVSGNGVVYGNNFQYGQESYKIGPLHGDCHTVYSFEISDNDVDGCSATFSLEEAVCCGDCHLVEMQVEQLCDEALTSGFVIDFEALYPRDSSFTLTINFDTIGVFNYDELPITVDYPSNAEEFRIEVSDNTAHDCRRVKEFKSACGEVDCPEIFEFRYEIGECFDGNQYFLFIAFGVEGVHSDSFYVNISEHDYGPFAYGMESYKIGPLTADCEPIKINIKDAERPDCIKSIEPDKIPCCLDCNIGIVHFEPTCKEGKMVGFVVKAGNAHGAKYVIKIGDREFGPFEYGETYTVDGIMLENGTYVVKLFDTQVDNCFLEHEFKVDCGSDCALKEMTVEAVNCTEETFYFNIDFQHNQVGSALFDLVINGDYQGTSSYSLLPVLSTRLNRNDGGPWKILIRDREHESCAIDLVIEEEMCTSSTHELYAQTSVALKGSDLIITGMPEGTKHRLTVVDAIGRTLMQQDVVSVDGNATLSMESLHSTPLIIVRIQSREGVFNKKLLFVR